MRNAPLVRDLLALLAEAGEAGMTAGDMTDRFTEPGGRMRRNNRIGQMLTRLHSAGRVTRGELERSPRYHRAWTRRWFITSSGRAYLTALEGEAPVVIKPGAMSRLEACAKARDQEKRRYLALREVLIAPQHPLTLSREERDAGILALRQAGCDHRLIGAVYGINRERVRQILQSLYSSQETE